MRRQASARGTRAATVHAALRLGTNYGPSPVEAAVHRGARRADARRMLASPQHPVAAGATAHPDPRDALDLVVQPIVDLRTGQIDGVHALPRFAAPDRELGRSPATERAAVAAAVAAARELPDGVFLAVALPAVALLDAALPDLLAADDRRRLVLELTEPGPVADVDALVDALEPLRAEGLRVCVRDAGTGLASLRDVAVLRPELIRLDAVLTRQIDHDPVRAALAHASVAVAGHVGASVVAEGNATRGELEALRGIGVRHGQGYLLAGPAPLAAQPDLHRALRLRAVGERPEPPPQVAVPARAREDVREASRHAASWLAAQLPGSARVAVHQLDHESRRAVVLAARGSLASVEQAGTATTLRDLPDGLMVAGRGARICGDVLADPDYGGLGWCRRRGVVSWIGAPAGHGDGLCRASVSAWSPEPDAFSPEMLEAADVAALMVGEAIARETCGLGHAQAAEHLRRLARSDELTGVLNAPGLADEIAAELRVSRGAAGTGRWYARLHIADLDAVCREHGRAVGDLVVKDVAAALTCAAGPGEVVGRADTDGFGALLVGRTRERAVEAFWTAVLTRVAGALAKRRVRADLRAAAVAFAPGADPESLAAAAVAALQPLAEL